MLETIVLKENTMDKLPYQFYDAQREIHFSRFDLPSPWINYLSNGRMHTFISQAGGGMSWWLLVAVMAGCVSTMMLSRFRSGGY